MPLWEQQLQAWCQANQVPWITHSLEALCYVTSGYAFAALGASLFFLLVLLSRAKEGAIVGLGILAGTTLIPPLKNLFQQIRPLVDGVARLSGYAFPSGHALSSTLGFGILALWLARRYPQHRQFLYAGAILLILAVSIARVYLSYHWVRDVLAGMAFGAMYLRLWWEIAGKLLPTYQNRRQSPQARDVK